MASDGLGTVGTLGSHSGKCGRGSLFPTTERLASRQASRRSEDLVGSARLGLASQLRTRRAREDLVLHGADGPSGTAARNGPEGNTTQHTYFRRAAESIVKEARRKQQDGPRKSNGSDGAVFRLHVSSTETDSAKGRSDTSDTRFPARPAPTPPIPTTGLPCRPKTNTNHRQTAASTAAFHILRRVDSMSSTAPLGTLTLNCLGSFHDPANLLNHQ
jgi:hypothetical protein